MHYLPPVLVSSAPNWSTNTQPLPPCAPTSPWRRGGAFLHPVVTWPKGLNIHSLDRLWAFSCSDPVSLSHHMFHLLSSYKCYFLRLKNEFEEHCLLPFSVPHSTLWRHLQLTQWNLSAPSSPMTDNHNATIVCITFFLWDNELFQGWTFASLAPWTEPGTY